VGAAIMSEIEGPRLLELNITHGQVARVHAENTEVDVSIKDKHYRGIAKLGIGAATEVTEFIHDPGPNATYQL
jgi:hypothetical protein